jgi:hypothetical protein
MSQRPQPMGWIGKSNLWRVGLVLLGLIGAVVVWRARPSSRPDTDLDIPEPPRLFATEKGCSRPDGLHVFAQKLEQHGRLRADRYPYDPHDGILAVRDYRQASDCYRSAGAPGDAARAEAAAMILRARIQTDYAAARMNLSRALQSKRWTVALAEARRLHCLTDHLGEHDYVQWLEDVMGRANARRTMAR